MAKYGYKDVLAVFSPDFVKDFDSVDVKVKLKSFLNGRDRDYAAIENWSHSNRENSTYQLLWILQSMSEEDVQYFVEHVLKGDDTQIGYGFLMNPIKKELEQPRQETVTYISMIDQLRNDNQRFSQYNISRMEPYLELQKALLSLRPAKNVLVEGVLGSGKKWLALDVCSSYLVQSQMDFKIFWLDMKNCVAPEMDLKLLESLLYKLISNSAKSPEHSSGLSIMQRSDHAKSELRCLLTKKPFKNCLLVLLNVQNVATLKTFNLGCKRLITTRNKSVTDYLSPETTSKIKLKDSLTKYELESMIVKYLRKEEEDLPCEAIKNLANHSNPRKLSIIAVAIREGNLSWNNCMNVNLAELTVIIESSLKVLEPQIRKLFDKLFIFPESAYIPINLLNLVWSRNNAITIVNKLHTFLLVEKQMDQQTITLPDIYRELRTQVDNEAELHQIIVDSYKITEVFDQNNDTTLSKLDSYFYDHIGHHLSKLDDRDKSVRLFRLVFLDFRFLDQKIRSDTTGWNAKGSILNTLQQLKTYASFIVDNQQETHLLFNALLDFLPKVEEQLVRSQYTCLLRVALMSQIEPIHKEAKIQVKRFPNLVWFTEHGRFHQERQIINLGNSRVHHANYLNDDHCLLCLDNNHLLLTNVSLEADTTFRISDKNDNSEILVMKVFTNQRYFLTLHSNGRLKLWSLVTDNNGRPLLPRRRSVGNRQNVRAPQVVCVPDHGSKQLINSIVKRSAEQNKISTFYLDEQAEMPNTTMQLHVTFENGDICIYDWDESQQFKASFTPSLNTRQPQGRCLVKVFNRFYVLSTASGWLTLWDLQSSSEVKNSMLNERMGARGIPLWMDAYEERLYTTVLFICSQSVWRIRLEKLAYAGMNDLKPELLHMQDTDAGAIKCAKRSHDACYLILGTEKGLLVYDLNLCETVLRSNVSEQIACVDIYELSDEIFKYIVLCGAVGKNVVHVHTLRNSAVNPSAITWVHNVSENIEVENNAQTHPCLEPNVYLLPLFAMTEGGTQLVAVDSKQRIHQIQTSRDMQTRRRSSNSSWATISPSYTSEKHRITAISAYIDGQVFVGYDDGTIWDVKSDAKLRQEFITEPIDYIVQLSNKILVASARSAPLTLIFHLPTEQDVNDAAAVSSGEVSSSVTESPVQLQLDTMYSRLLNDHALLLFSESGVCLVDCSNTNYCRFVVEVPLLGFDLQCGLLFLALTDSTIKVYQMDEIAGNFDVTPLCSETIKEQRHISYLVASNDGSLFALGFAEGHIELYGYSDRSIKLIYILPDVHKQVIRQLRFSPCNQVLISCAEQLCFWSVTHMRNNELVANHPQRRSSRFRSRAASLEEVDALPIAACNKARQERKQRSKTETFHKSPWQDKHGNIAMPELLACIKFVGNSAGLFFQSADNSEWYVIDDEGVYYHLRLLQPVEQEPEPEPLTHILRSINQLPIEQVVKARVLSAEMNSFAAADDKGVDVVGNVVPQLELQQPEHLPTI